MDHNHHQENFSMPEPKASDYVKFVGILLSIFAVSLVLEFSDKSFNTENFMRLFMAVFFLVFGIFKLLDLKGFVMSYIGYDIIAKRSIPYAYAYPFIELALALGYFLNVGWINYVTLTIMIVGALGVGRELFRGSKIKCACLGTYINLPLTTVSLIEDVSMGIMAAWLIFQ